MMAIGTMAQLALTQLTQQTVTTRASLQNLPWLNITVKVTVK